MKRRFIHSNLYSVNKEFLSLALKIKKEVLLMLEIKNEIVQFSFEKPW